MPPGRLPRAFRNHQRATVSVLGVLVAGLLATLAIGWYFSSQIERGVLDVSHDPAVFDLSVLAVDGMTVTLEPTPDADLDGHWSRTGSWGLEWEGGYGQVGAIRDRRDKRIVRDFTLLEGALNEGTLARIDPFAFPPDPFRAFGLRFEEVTVDGELGRLPAWYVPTPGSRWAILVHGQGAERRDMLRMLRPVHEAGLNVLVISYRNDEALAHEPDGHYHLGLTEWKDLDAATQYALDHGATELVLGGNSMGGAIIMSFLRESPRAEQVSGLILEAPLLDLDATVRTRAPQALPGVFVSVAESIASRRFGLDWGRLDFLSGAAELSTPILLFHGEEDGTVPIATSRELARLRPDLVTFFPVVGARHVQAWNMDPAAFDKAIAEFLALRRLAPAP